MDSILTLVKKMCGGISEEDESFDDDIITYVNNAFAFLTQLGVGSPSGFSIHDKSSIWTDYISAGPLLELVKTYICTKARLMFDPPQTAALMDSLKQIISENEWRILNQVETASTEEENQNVEQ